MSTRARIYVECESRYLISSLGFGSSMVPHNAKFAHIYCHYDGYPSGVGKMLLENYNSYEKAIELIANGDMSSIGDSVETTEYYSTEEDFCGKPMFTANPLIAMKGQFMYNYYYLYTKTNGWQVFRSVGGKLVYPKTKNIYPYIKGNKIECLGNIEQAINITESY